MPFKLQEPQRFRTTKLDMFVVTVVFIVFMWAFFIDSFRPYLNETGIPITIMTDRGIFQLNQVNMQVFIAPLILCYEMVVLIIYDGKLKGRELPWKLYFLEFKMMVYNKLKEGMDEYHEWKKLKK